MNELDKAFESFARPMGKENSAEMRMYFMAGVAYADNTVANVTKAELKQALRLAGEEQTRLWAID